MSAPEHQEGIGTRQPCLHKGCPQGTAGPRNTVSPPLGSTGAILAMLSGPSPVYSDCGKTERIGAERREKNGTPWVAHSWLPCSDRLGGMWPVRSPTQQPGPSSKSVGRDGAPLGMGRTLTRPQLEPNPEAPPLKGRNIYLSHSHFRAPRVPCPPPRQGGKLGPAVGLPLVIPTPGLHPCSQAA